MKDLNILADMCVEVNKLLHQMYEKGVITKEIYEDHIRLKLNFLQDMDMSVENDEII